MKIKNTWLVILCFIVTLTQEVEGQVGNYCWDEDFITLCYEFKENNRFEFYHLMSVAQEVGRGEFEIKNDKIRFIYEPIDFFQNQFKIKKAKNSNNLKIKFQVKDYDTGKFINNYIVSQEKNGQHYKHIKTQKNTKKHKKTKFKLGMKATPSSLIFLVLIIPITLS